MTNRWTPVSSRGGAPPSAAPPRGRLLACALLLSAVGLVWTSAAGAHGAAVAPPELHSYGAAVRVAVLRGAAASWGGVYTTSRGEKVTVYVSDRYPRDEAVGQRWAEFVGSLVHGDELGTATIFLSPPSEVSTRCGEGALACYSTGARAIVAPAEDAPAGPTAKAILAHEYGHHVAASRVNTPGRAVDWGTKRWATAARVCARARDGTAFPGGGRNEYHLDPGEAFAESYRVLNERRLGLPETEWAIVDRSFYPDEAALAAVEQDVVAPWTTPSFRSLGGRFVRKAPPTRRLTVATALDGTAAATLRAPAKTRFVVELLGSGGFVVARGTSTGKAVRVDAPVCGSRSIDVRVRRVTGFGRYALTVSTP